MNADSIRLVSYAKLKLLKENQKKKPIGQRISNAKIEAYDKYMSLRQESIALAAEAFEYFGLDEQTVDQLNDEFYELRGRIVAEIAKVKTLEAATKKKVAPNVTGPYSPNPAARNRMVDKKTFMEMGISMMGSLFNIMIDDLTRDNEVDEDKKVTLAVLFEMLKEEQKKKKNGKDRISDKMIDEVAEISLSKDREAAFGTYLKANFNTFNHAAVTNIQKEALEIKKTNLFKVRFAEALKKSEMGMEKQEKSDSDNSEDEGEIQLTDNTVTQLVATKPSETSRFAGRPLFIVSICLLTAFSAVFYHDFFNLFV